jgi:hypothetical protein
MAAKLHELLAAEKTPTGAWNQLYEDTLKKFKNPAHFFNGHSKSLKMINESPENAATEDQNRDEKPVTTTVFDTLDYALDIFAKAEDLQYQKNKTNTKALGTVMWKGQPFLVDLPVDELLGLEARLTKLRQLFAEIPTLDATKSWVASNLRDVWQVEYPEDTVKTEKVIVPVELSKATDKHPAQVQAVGKDIVVGKFTLLKRSGEATAQQKADMLKLVDELMVEVKQARMRANETEAVTDKIAHKITVLLLGPLQTK